MSNAPSAREVGSVGIRALPMTDKFRNDLYRKLRVIERQSSFRVNVDRAIVDRTKVRNSIRTQLQALERIAIDVDVDVNLRKLKQTLKSAKDSFTENSWVDDAFLNRMRKDIDKTIGEIEVALKPEIDDDLVREAVDDLRDEFKKLEGELSANLLTPAEQATIRNRIEGIRGQLEGVRGELTAKSWVDDAFLSRMRSDIERNLRDIEVTLSPDVDDEEVRVAVNGLRQEFETLQGKLSENILTPEESAVVRERINGIKDELDELARDRTVRVDVNPFTAWASARLAWLTRPRVVEIIPNVSQAALAKAAAALGALSGARLTGDYLERMSKWLGEIDLKLPSIAFSALAVTTAFSGIMGTISGIVGIGDGLAATLPSLLLLPGLFAGAAMSAVALVVALKHSKDELSELGPSFTNLGGIIRKAFWQDARPAIIEFINSIMPQLERSFDRTAGSIGRFTAALSGSFERTFANGELERMFDGLAESWDILATGTDAFARAITNLGLVAARYMPRLAQWFVDLSIKFDNWLAAVASDGRLDQWIEEAIDAFYALWDVMAATTGIFQALWKAAEAGGSGGLRGFADMLLAWEAAIQGARWQETLTAMFRGARVALEGFGEGLERVGIMLHTTRDDLEYFMGRAGQILGEFIGEVADALSLPGVGDNLRQFIDGVGEGLRGLQPALGPMALALSAIAGFAGELAAVLGPVLGRAFEVLSPLVVDVLDALEPLIPILGEALMKAIEKVTPVLETLIEKFIEALPGIVDFMGALLENSPELLIIVGAFAALASVVGKLVGFIVPAVSQVSSFMEVFTGGKGATPANSVGKLAGNFGGLAGVLGRVAGVAGIVISGFLIMWEQSEQLRDGIGKLFEGLVDLGKGIGDVIARMSAGGDLEWLGKLAGFVWDLAMSPLKQVGDLLGGLAGSIGEFMSAMGLLMQGDLEGTRDALQSAASEWFSALVPDDIQANMLEDLAQIKAAFDEFFADPGSWLADKGVPMMGGLIAGLEEGILDVQTWFVELPGRIREWFGEQLETLKTRGSELATGVRDGLEEAFPKIGEWLGQLPGRIIGFFIEAGTWLIVSGLNVLGGLKSGIETKYEEVKTWLQELPGKVKAFFANAHTWLTGEGDRTVGGYKSGIETGWQRVVAWFSVLPAKIGTFFGGVGEWLVESGKALMGGFAEGIRQSIETIKQEVANALAEIRGAFPSSPAKWGPFSGRGWVSYSGEAVGDTFGESVVASLRGARKAISGELGGIQSEFAAVDSAAFSTDVSSARAQARAGTIEAISTGVGALSGASGRSVQVSLAGMQVNAVLVDQPFTMLIEDHVAQALEPAMSGALNSQLGTSGL